MAICTYLVSADLGRDCDHPLVQGFETTAYIINKVDIASTTRTGNIVSAISLASGKYAKKIIMQSKQPFNGSTCEMEEGTVSNKFNKTAKFVVMNDGPAISQQIDALANGEFVVVVETKFESSDKGKFEIIGLEAGAKASAIVCDKYSDDTDGGWDVTLTEAKAPTSKVFCLSTDIAATRTMLDGLLAPAQ